MTTEELNIELQEKFPTVKDINEELKRIAPRKREHRIWSQLGNVESRERYHNILRYEKQLKSLKEQLKNNK